MQSKESSFPNKKQILSTNFLKTKGFNFENALFFKENNNILDYIRFSDWDLLDIRE